MQTQDPAQIIRERAARSTQRQVAQELGITQAYLSDIVRGKRIPGPKVLAALGIVREIIYLSAADERS